MIDEATEAFGRELRHAGDGQPAQRWGGSDG
jgi:hypothetical protein